MRAVFLCLGLLVGAWMTQRALTQNRHPWDVLLLACGLLLGAGIAHHFGY